MICFRCNFLRVALLCDVVLSVIPPMEGEHATYLRRALELYPFFAQCFIIPGMALERWILICRPADATSLLGNRIKYYLYVGVSVAAFLVPTCFFLEFVRFQLHPVETQLIAFYPTVVVGGEILRPSVPTVTDIVRDVSETEFFKLVLSFAIFKWSLSETF